MRIRKLKQTHSSHPRNPKITNVFYRRGLIEEMGMGTQKIIQSYKSQHLLEPEFLEQAGTFVVRLWSRYRQATLLVEKLTSRQQAILTTLRSGKLSPKKIIEALTETITERTLRRELDTLKNKGYVNFEVKQGKNRRWFIT